MTVTVIDVSRYQAGLNLSAFKAQGGLAVIAKASEGLSSADPEFALFRIQAAANGLAFASYHYLTTDPPAGQAAWYLKCAAPENGERVCADWEASGVAAAMVVAFLQAIQKARPDLELTVYAGAAAKTPAIDAASSAWLKAYTSLWLAQYTTGTPSWPTATWATYSLWQYADTGTIPGWSSPIDMNRFHGSDANLLKWFGPAAAPQPTPAPSIPTITIATTGAVNLIVNGVKIATSP